MNFSLYEELPAEATERARRHAEQAGHQPPTDRERSLREQDERARKVGWVA